MLVVSGVAADLDYLSYFGGPAAFLRFHRTVLHSVLGSALVALIVAAAFFGVHRLRNRTVQSTKSNPAAPGFRVGVALLVCAIAAASHVLLDLVSGVGVQPFWPFRAGWKGWELLNNLDPWILTLLAAALLLPQLLRLVSEEIGEQKKTFRGRRAAITALAILVLYIGARAGLHSQAINLLDSREYHGRPPVAAAAFPMPATPFIWRGVGSTDATIEELQVSLLPGAEFDPDSGVTRYKPETSAALDAGQRTEAATTFLAYARIPFASVNRVDDGYRFELHDLRFASNDASPENIFVRVDFNSSLQIKSDELRYASSKSP
jgi:membrane-bound metal-dependent hydrolase YbcI (DUF457 family)